MAGKGHFGIGGGHQDFGNETYYKSDTPNRDMLRKWIINQKHADIYIGKTNVKQKERTVFMGRYKAKLRGYIKGQGIIEPGQEFIFDGPKGSWMIPVEEKIESHETPNNADIYKAAATLAKKPPSVLDHVNIPQTAVSPIEKEPVKMGRPKAKR